MAVCSPRLCSLRRRSFYAGEAGHPTFIIRRWVQATPVIHDSLENATRQRGNREMGLRTCLHRAKAILPSLAENTESRIFLHENWPISLLERYFALQRFMFDCLENVRHVWFLYFYFTKLRQSYKVGTCRGWFYFFISKIFFFFTFCLKSNRRF